MIEEIKTETKKPRRKLSFSEDEIRELISSILHDELKDLIYFNVRVANGQLYNGLRLGVHREMMDEIREIKASQEYIEKKLLLLLGQK